MPSSAWAVTAAAGSAVATAKPRAKCFRRMAVSPLFAAGLHRRVFNWPSISSAENEGSRPAAAGAGIAVECAPSIRKGPHPQFLFADLPQAREPVWLQHQKHHDQGADNREG